MKDFFLDFKKFYDENFYNFKHSNELKEKISIPNFAIFIFFSEIFFDYLPKNKRDIISFIILIITYYLSFLIYTLIKYLEIKNNNITTLIKTYKFNKYHYEHSRPVKLIGFTILFFIWLRFNSSIWSDLPNIPRVFASMSFSYFIVKFIFILLILLYTVFAFLKNHIYT